MQNYAKRCKIKRKLAKLFKAMRKCVKLRETKQNYAKLCKTMRNLAKLRETQRKYSKLCETKRNWEEEPKILLFSARRNPVWLPNVGNKLKK